MRVNNIPSVLFVLLSVFFSTVAVAESFRARIVKVQGDVYIVNTEGKKRTPQKQSFLVNSNETVVTSNNSKAVLQFDDGAMSVLDEKSSLRVEKSGWLSQLGGKIYYVFRKAIGKSKSKKVKTKFATIGIRGTTFIVDAGSDNQQVALQEGNLNIESPGDDYEFHKPQPEESEFDAFMRQAAEKQQALNDEFADYKEDLNKEFVEFKKSFDMKANHVVSFNGNRVNESKIDDDLQVSFDGFAHFSKEYVDAYKELDESSVEDELME